MSELNLNKEPEKTQEAPKPTKGTPFKNREMCHWIIRLVEGEEDVIEARNNVSGETFNGTISEFNGRLK